MAGRDTELGRHGRRSSRGGIPCFSLVWGGEDVINIKTLTIQIAGVYTNSMKSLLASIAFASFIGIAVFGIFSMHMDMQNHDGGCIAATAQGTDCPRQLNPLEYLAFHLDAFRNFSTATFSSVTALLSILSLFVIGIAVTASLENLALPKLKYSWLERSASFSPPYQHKLLRWLALHENSPAIL